MALIYHNLMEVKRVLVTGGAGFIGSHLVDELIKKGHKVTIVDNLSTGEKENLNPKAKFYNLDIRDSKISEVFEKEKPQIIFHLAAHLSVQDSIIHPSECSSINILGSLNLIENLIRFNENISDCKFIFSSTGGAIYGDASVVPTSEDYIELPLSPYGVSKLAFEKYLNYYYEIFKLPFVSLRYANVYGPRQKKGVIPIFCNNMLKKQKVIINNDGQQTRDFVFVKDVVKANLLSMENKLGIFNIGMKEETTVNTIFDKINSLIGLNSEKEYKELKFKEQSRSCLDNSKALKELGWIPDYNFDRGLRKTVNWFKGK